MRGEGRVVPRAGAISRWMAAVGCVAVARGGASCGGKLAVLMLLSSVVRIQCEAVRRRPLAPVRAVVPLMLLPGSRARCMGASGRGCLSDCWLCWAMVGERDGMLSCVRRDLSAVVTLSPAWVGLSQPARGVQCRLSDGLTDGVISWCSSLCCAARFLALMLPPTDALWRSLVVVFFHAP